MSAPSRWLNWTPGQPTIMRTSTGTEPSKASKSIFDGFDGSVSEEGPTIHAPEPASEKPEGGCPYQLPAGVRLVRYEPKAPPVAVTVCSVVTDVPKFIQHALEELDARLHHPVQIKAGGSVFELLSKLGDCGLELRLEWPPEGQIMGESREGEPTKPTKVAVPEINAHGGDLTDEDIPH